ncbi:MAG: BLUF domain-containing protein [Nitrosomonadales bacterium]|nr:BLUF domain-containing protein [Nitrosomonadales bacterium]
MNTDKLTAIVYLSTASHPMTEGDIEHILLAARRRNEQKNITGLLLYCHGTFMQYLEGDEAGLLEVYELIKKDRRHRGLIQLAKTPIHSREFADWSMACASHSKTVIDQLSQADWLESGDSKSRGRMLLSKFWKSNVGKSSSH